ncbi:putative rhamnosyl transferase [uncultured Ruegeria sp.]|uniref:putative rhamnosyl transferase n=1 Tax=uncultured Ruegeria sp. TaxID=259304 RepID=UPI0026170905|nr:putative rhamnosyl transferase [uncultured Ruegeria sp.]
MQVIGLCRFSYPAIGGYQIQHETIDERRRYLYSPARLDERFRLFESSTLPCIREQTDEDFEFLIVIGNCLPKEPYDRLMDLTAGIRQIRILGREPGQHRTVMKEVLNSSRKDPDKPCLQFRHDDDDAVSVDFVERLRIAAHDSRGVIERNRTVGIDFNNGFIARFGSDGVRAKPIFNSLLGVGLGMYVAGKCTQTIMSFTHNRIGRFMPVVSFPDAPMWVRALNSFNDSHQARNDTRELPLLSSKAENEFVARFAIDQNTVRKIHSTG